MLPPADQQSWASRNWEQRHSPQGFAGLLALRDVTSSMCLSLNAPVHPYLGAALGKLWVTLTSRDCLASNQTRRCPGPVGLPGKPLLGNKILADCGRSTESTTRSASPGHSRFFSPKLLLGIASEFARCSRTSKPQYCRLENWIPSSIDRRHRYLLLWPSKQDKTKHASDANTKRTTDEHNVDTGPRI